MIDEASISGNESGLMGSRVHESVLRAVIDIPRWLLLAALVYAPWAYGSTPAWAIRFLEFILGVIIIFWLAGWAFRRMTPHVHPVMLACIAWILLQGWFMALNPHFRDSGDFRFTPISPWLRWAPGSVDGNASIVAMLRITALLGVACFVSDVSTRRIWRRRVWWTAGATGVSIVLFGLFQSASVRPILWQYSDRSVPFFSTYYYHGNAGSFINLVLPLVAGFAILTLRKPDAHLSRMVWLPGVFVCTAGAFVNVSRSAMVVTVLLCAILLAWQFSGSARKELLPPRKLRLAYAVLMIAALFCLVGFSGWERPAQKWALMERQLNSSNTRLVTYKICMRMIPDAGWHGFGPGTFLLTFPHYTGPLGDEIPGIWRYAHDDYLQTIIEWGWFGAIPWAILFFGSIGKSFANWGKMRATAISDRVLLFASGLALSGVALHALVDFPLQIASLQLYIATYAGLAWSSDAWMENPHPGPGRPTPGMITSGSPVAP